MSLYENWMRHAFSQNTEQVDALWEGFLPKEQKIYEYMLGEKVNTLSGKVSDLATKYEMTPEEFVGFMDGINESLDNRFKKLDTIEESTEVTLEVNFEKLYKKMVEYKADHLVSLPQWDNVFSVDERKKLSLEQKKSRTVINTNKIGRNDPCNCGSGKKYKKCCGAN